MDYKYKLTKEKDMFVEFEKTDLRAKPGGSIWISPDNVCTVEVIQEAVIDNEKINDNALYGPINYIQPPITKIKTSDDMAVYVLCDLQRTLDRLS
jgi:hypothetical protein